MHSVFLKQYFASVIVHIKGNRVIREKNVLRKAKESLLVHT